MAEACHGWVTKYTSADTRSNYRLDVGQFLSFSGLPTEEPEKLLGVRPHHVTAWRDHLSASGLTNNSIRRKLTVLRSLFGFLQRAGLVATNPAHSDFVAAPAVPRDGKTVGLAPGDCRRLLEAPPIDTPAGLRDRALLAVLAFTGCRVGELTRLKVGSIKMAGVHRVIEVMGKGGKERRVPLHPEAAERLEAWLDAAGIRDQRNGPLFRARRAPTADNPARFSGRPLTRRAVQKLVSSLVRRLRLDPNVSVHSLRVTALTTARERGCDVIDLQDFAGHSDPRTTLTYIRNRDRLSKSPAYALSY
ncbi:tyrosine-type recombinase/integrase [Zavarzinella formosa]|uniref:tyrosine-type recombinase/integrase n=1 Tax=Zavarzinella formosa TaxID=360055 RepID=UPI001EE684CD|nr:tyrosine-type recombinase/integrase [Zavarzinella formosa]